MKPTGSKDPFALRRAALGVVRIILENGVRLKLEPYLWLSTKNLPHSDEVVARLKEIKLVGDFKSEEFRVASHAKVEAEINSIDGYLTDLLVFSLDRLKVYLRDQGIRHDIIDAALTEGQDDLVAIVNRVNALQDFLSTPDGENLLAGYKRAANILKAEAKKGDLPEGEANRPANEQGAALFDALTTASPAIKTALESENYASAMGELANLRTPIDAFFTHTQIISDDTAVKDNNLRLLGMMRDTARQIADFEALQS